jgi:hypothetical protein
MNGLFRSPDETAFAATSVHRTPTRQRSPGEARPEEALGLERPDHDQHLRAQFQKPARPAEADDQKETDAERLGRRGKNKTKTLAPTAL